MGGGEIEKFIKVWITAISCLCHCYYISSRIPKGFLRLFSLIPILYLFIILPFNISSPNLVGYTSFFLVQATLKILLFSFNQGPLAPSNNIFHFISIASLPITPKQDLKNTTTTNNNNKPKWLLPLKVLIFATIARAYNFNEYMHPHFILVLYCCHLYLGLELALGFIRATIRTVFGFEIEPQFNEPYLSTSLQDFWGRRWNLLITRLLRPTVYHPVRRISTPFVGPSCATSSAMLATFVVSGLMHELIYYHVTRVPPTWEVTCFFVLHGVCTVAEVAVKRVALRHGWRLYGALSAPFVAAFLAVTARWLFFPQLLRNEMDRKSTEEYGMLMDFVKSKLPLGLLKCLII